jgi:hypothetical protein
MKHPDDTDECASFVRARAVFLINNGMQEDDALEEAIDYWRASQKRVQEIVRLNADLRAHGKPTLHVPLFEAAKLR